MKASPQTGMGLTIHNSTFYNTFDIVALLNAFEASLKKSQRIFHVSALGTVDGQISFRDYCGNRPTERVYLKGYIGDAQIYVRKGHGANRGVYKLRKPSQMFDNDVQQLVWESDENKVMPHDMVKQLLENVAQSYSVEPRYIDAAVRRVDLSQHPVRVLKHRAAPATKGKGNSKQRRNAKSALTSLEFRLKQAAGGVSGVIAHFSQQGVDGAENHLYRDVVAVRGEFPELGELQAIVSRLNEICTGVAASAAAIVAPEFEKESAE